MNPEPVHTDIAVVGAGPAGLSAAVAAAVAGASVTVIDAYSQPGGQYFRQPNPAVDPDPQEPHQRAGRELWHKASAAGVRFLNRTVVWGAFEDLRLAAYREDTAQAIELQADAIILAPGTYERVAAFPGWTLPGVITTGAAQTLLKEQRLLPGQRIILAGTGPLQLVTAAALVKAGAQVVAVLEGASPGEAILRQPGQTLAAVWGQSTRLKEGWQSWRTLKKAGVPYHRGWGIIAAEGKDSLQAVRIARLDRQWRPIPGTERRLEADTLCLNYGFTPATELAQLFGVQLHWRPAQGGFVPRRDEQMQTNVPGLFIVGDGAGVGGAELAMVEGQIAGLAAARQVLGDSTLTRRIEALQPALRREQRFQQFYARLFTPGPGLDELAAGDTPICRCEGVSKATIVQTIHAGADTMHAVKAVTRCGMGNCQGRVCGPLVAAILAQETGQSPERVGQFRARTPIFPVPLTAFTVLTTEGAESAESRN